MSPGGRNFRPRAHLAEVAESGDTRVVFSFTTRIAAALVVVAAVLSCCASPSPGDGPRAGQADDSPVITGEPAAYNDDDIAFASKIVACEEQGIDLSNLVPGRSDDPDLVAFAAKSAEALRMEVQVLKVLQLQWDDGQARQADSAAPGIATGGAVDSATMAKLGGLRGTAFDALWLQSAIGIAQGVIEIAGTEIGKGKNKDAIDLAKQIAAARQGDIALMQQMVAG